MRGSFPFIELCTIHTGIYKHYVNHVIITLRIFSLLVYLTFLKNRRCDPFLDGWIHPRKMDLGQNEEFITLVYLAVAVTGYLSST